MADLSITAANVIKGANAKTVVRYALEAITAGKSLYEQVSDSSKVGLYDADDASAEKRVLRGVALNAAGVGQPVVVQYDGDIAIGATVAVGTVYLGSDTAGGIRPDADRNTGDAVSILGIGKSASVIQLQIANSGIVSA